MMRTENFPLTKSWREVWRVLHYRRAYPLGIREGTVLHGQLVVLEKHHARSIVHHLTFMGINPANWKNAKIVAKTHGDARNTLSENNEQVLINTMSHRAARGGVKQEGGEKEANA